MKKLQNPTFLDSFLPLKEPLVATLSEICALTSRKRVSKSDISIPNL